MLINVFGNGKILVFVGVMVYVFLVKQTWASSKLHL